MLFPASDTTPVVPAMPYKQLSSPDLGRIRPAVATLLSRAGIPIAERDDAEIYFESSGYSGRVHRLVLNDRSGNRISLLLKGGEVELLYRLYQDVLAPLQLDSPRMYGIVDAHAPYLVMEYVPHDPPDWQDVAKFQRAIDWLAHKDRTAEEHLDRRITGLPYVQPFSLGSLQQRLAVLRWASQEQLDPLLNDGLVRTIEANSDRFHEAAARVLQGPQTLVHNDFQMLNILFSGDATPAQGIHVVDWTCPAMGSVCIDLATLLHVAPPEVRGGLIERYLAARPVPDFAALLAAAQVHIHLSILTWMADALRSGDARAVSRPKMRELVEQLKGYFRRSPRQPQHR